MNEQNEHGWVVTLSAVEHNLVRQRVRTVAVESKQTELTEAVRDAQFRLANDAHSRIDTDSVKVVDAAAVPAPRGPQP